MYNQVGKELKGWAKFIVILLTIPFVAIGILLLVALIDADLAFLGSVICLVTVLLGYALARLSGIILYAFGEIVDRLASIDDRGSKPQVMGNTVTRSTAAAPEKKVPGSWTCMSCGHTNLPDAKWCDGCKETTKP